MFLRALPGALSRRRWARAFIHRNGPFARPTSPSAAASAEKISKILTGSGLDHSPDAQALYQPTEPEVASRTRAIQLDKCTIAVGPSARNPRCRLEPSGSVVSIPPVLRRLSISSSTRLIAGALRRATNPPPVANRRSARTRCSPRVLMGREYELN